MREALACLAVLALIAGCSKAPAAHAASAPASAPAAASAPAVSGVYTAGGQPATLTEVTAHNDDPFDGKPVIALVFTAKPQSGDADADSDAHQGTFGDAIIVHVQPGGVVIGADLVHHGLVKSDGYVTAVGLLSLKDYVETGGQLSGRLTSGGPNDAGGGQTVNVDLTFHAKAP